MKRGDVKKKTAFIHFGHVRKGRFPNCVSPVLPHYYSIVVAVSSFCTALHSRPSLVILYPGVQFAYIAAESSLLTVLQCTADLAS